MSTTTTPRRRGFRLATALCASALALTVTACSAENEAEPSPDTPATTTEAGAWPRTVDTADGPVTLESRPERIVSTSVTLTGSLLALDAPLIGTGAQPPSTVTDDQGLFVQWADIVEERDVDVLYQGEPNIEAITAATPDLIVVSTSGADSAAENVDLLSQIAPTLVFDYSDKSWQELTTQLADAIGAEERAEELLAEFDEKVDNAKSAIEEKLGTDASASILTYNTPNDSRIFTSESAQGRLVSALGLTVAPVPAEIAGSPDGNSRSDVVSVAVENLPLALTGDTTFIINAQQPDAERLKNDPTLAAVRSVESGQVYALGYDSFRLDFYSATNVVERIVDALS